MTGKTIKKNEEIRILNEANVEEKREYFKSGVTTSYSFRIKSLKTLREAIVSYEGKITDALYRDLHKPPFEAYSSEISLVYEEIDFSIKRLHRWMKPKRVRGSLINFPSKDRVYSEPLGTVLIVGPWNYPFQLIIAPLIGALAAGNCAVLKPSKETPTISAIIGEIIEKAFEKNHVSVVQGSGSITVPYLMDKYRFDHVFFTGSPAVGASIGQASAAKHTPFTLELGGKSPAVIDMDVDLKVAVNRLLWAKFFNGGQTCVSPDYLLIHRSRVDKFFALAQEILKDRFGDNPLESENLAHMVNDRRMDVLISYLDSGKIRIGGQYDRGNRIMAPTLMDQVKTDSDIMEDEIFGPILPVIPFDDPEEVLQMVEQHPHPLAAYFYGNDKKRIEYWIRNIQFGGGCINNSLIHLTNPRLPFGGIGPSGTGSYHGEYSFRRFSHYKSIIDCSTAIDIKIKYPPYGKKGFNILKKFS